MIFHKFFFVVISICLLLQHHEKIVTGSQPSLSSLRMSSLRTPHPLAFAFPRSGSYEFDSGNNNDGTSNKRRQKKKQKNSHNKIGNAYTENKKVHQKHNLIKRNYKETSDDEDVPQSTTSESRKRPTRSYRHTASQNNAARKKYKEQRRQQRSNDKNGSSNRNRYSKLKQNHANNSKNKRPFRKMIDIDLSKPTFTYHTLAPKLNLSKPVQRKKSLIDENQLDESIPISKKHIVSPSVLKENEQNCIPYICGQLPITYTNDANTVEKWLCDNVVKMHGCDFSFVGFDVEAVPNVPWRESAFPNRPATVQLSTPYSSIVLHLTSHYDGNINTSKSHNLKPLQALLSDPTILKVGAGIDDDMLALYRWDNSLQARSRFDIGGIGSSSKRQLVGLERLVRAIVGVELAKSKSVTMSDWSQTPLTIKQLNYASRDAWAGAAVMKNVGDMYEETMNVDLIGRKVLKFERNIVDVDIRARERKEAKRNMKEIQSQMRIVSPREDGGVMNVGNKHNILPSMWPDVVREEIYRLQQIIDVTAPDGVLFFPQDRVGLDFSFEKKRNHL